MLIVYQFIYYVCTLTMWSSGREAVVHLTQSVAANCHTPYHNPLHPAKQKSVKITHATLTCWHPVASWINISLPAAALEDSVSGGEVFHLECILHSPGTCHVEPSCGRPVDSGQPERAPAGEPWCTGTRTRVWPQQGNTSRTFALK